MEVYLTRMWLNPQSRQVRNEIGNFQELHKTISGAFPAIENQAHLKHHERETPRNKFDVLHRLEIDARRGELRLLVQSTVKPDWSEILERKDFLADADEDFACKEIGASYAAIENGMRLRFRLRANPTKRIGGKYQHPDEKKREEFAKKFRDEKNRRRIFMNTDEERLEWLRQKGAVKIEKDKKTGGGFRLANVTVKEDVQNVAEFQKNKIKVKRDDSKAPMIFGSIVFEGILEVTDAEQFCKALVKGIGSGKAYGFGLLSIAPVKEN